MTVCKRCRTFMIGMGLGVAAGVMLAPKPGAEIRQELFGGGRRDDFEEPGTEDEGQHFEPEATEDLKAKIEETRARLKAEIEAQPDE
ncbi:MAG: YtxH domain-containing protein [Thermoleophilia bacterium]